MQWARKYIEVACGKAEKEREPKLPSNQGVLLELARKYRAPYAPDEA